MSGRTPPSINLIHAALNGTSSVSGHTEAAGLSDSASAGVMKTRCSCSIHSIPTATTATIVRSILESAIPRALLFGGECPPRHQRINHIGNRQDREDPHHRQRNLVGDPL